MTIRVLFFAHLRERCGREARVEMAEGTSIADLWTQLRAQHPVLQDASVRFALNCVYVDTAEVLHDNDELTVDDADQIERTNERMADIADAIEGLLLLLGAHAIDVHGIQVAEDELDRFEQPARGFAFPDFAKPA